MQDMELNARGFGVAGALLGFLGVGLGAFGAHVLEARLSAQDLETFETAVRYQTLHALALLLVPWLASRGRPRAARTAGTCFTAGVVIFSGSLYLLVATGERWLGAVTPLGGVAFLLGWLALAWSFAPSGAAPPTSPGS